MASHSNTLLGNKDSSHILLCSTLMKTNHRLKETREGEGGGGRFQCIRPGWLNRPVCKCMEYTIMKS